ncbi:dicarboxylate/amino acid:cation symporter [Salinisphaera sp. T31B1]|uniref:dicarboxylate/amino acid:cation symporter n=1 Tax=Salinisphaera sp. T31B1 TaxID=727963 RepID=UPI003340F1B6
MSALFARYVRVSLISKISMALVLGVVAGLWLPEAIADGLAPIGDVVLRLLRFLILPIVVTTVIVGINQSGLARLGRTGALLALYYLATTAIAMIVGLSVAQLFQPGRGLSPDSAGPVEVPSHPGAADVLTSIVPDNIVAAFAQLDMLAVLFTAIVFGVAIAFTRAAENDPSGPGETLYRAVAGLESATLRIMGWVLEILPLGILAIVAHTVAEQGGEALTSLASMVGVLYLGLAGQLVFYTVLLLAAGLAPLRFYSAARSAMATAFATQSSSGTLPVTLAAAERMGVRRSIRGVALPLGATVNMDGAAVRIAVSAVFAANVVGLSLGWSQAAEIVLVGTLISVGTAGVPGAGIVMIATVFEQVGLPIETVALLASIDALVGMGATALNVTGDLVGARLVERLTPEPPR